MGERKYPRGVLNAEDEGQVAMAVGVENNTVVIRFPKPVAWLGLGAEEARGLAKLLEKGATQIEH